MSAYEDSVLINVNKGEGRILMIPVIGCKDADWFVNMPDTADCLDVGRAVLDAISFVRRQTHSAEAQEKHTGVAAWKRNTKYKSWISFWKHNHYGGIETLGNGQYKIYSLKKSEEKQGLYTECIKKTYLPADADVEEIGRTVIDVLEASEAYYQDYRESKAWRRKVVELADGTNLKVTVPKDRHFEDCEDCNAAEIYQCYEYHTQEGSESSAEFFVGMAAELDCSLVSADVLASWEDIYGKADFFEMQEVNRGIFKFRAEMRNQDCHKISCFLQTSEDLLLECGMQVHQPNRRKKLDEKLAVLFEEFALSCSF